MIMMQKLFSILLLSGLLLISCQDVKRDSSLVQQDLDTIVNDSGTLANIEPDNTYMLLACVYQQTAAEYSAMCYQAYNAARAALIADLNDRDIDKPRAVILDVDETVLDNSPFQAACILNNTDYPVGWDEWCEMAIARPVPGVKEFLQLTNGYGVKIFYVTNRKEHLKEATLKNLQLHEFPQVNDEHLLMRTTTSDKEPRREQISENYHISLLVGDNLGDFSKDFYKKEHAERQAAVDSLNTSFGQRFIVLPNPMYGDWESVLYHGRHDLDDAAKLLILHDMLIGPERM